MTDLITVRRLVRVASVGLLATVLAAPVAAPAAAPTARPFPSSFALPNGFQPEGITIGGGHQAWLGSRVDGDIWAFDLRTGQGQKVSEGPGTASVGMKIDHQGRLFVAGGPAGNGRVVDADTGAVLATYQFAAAPTFVNDVVLTKDAAWFTDSQRAQLYKVPLGPNGELPAQSAVVTLPLSGDWQQVAGFNANGITQTPDHQALLVVNSTTGLLYRVDPATGAATAVDLGGASVSAGDGMLLVRGRTLMVVRNQLNLIAVFRLDASGTAGELKRDITSGDFDTPTTVARFGHRLYLPNARFTTAPTPATTYDVIQVSLHQPQAG
jgi:sugar lactone lactonase YvrE